MDDELSRLRWQCRRGMRELDDLLQAYLESRYAAAPAADKAAFRRLLALSDPELVSYLLQDRQPDPSLARVVEVIRHRVDS